MRPFGGTGAVLPVIGLGCQRLVEVAGCRETDAAAILQAALDGGVRYFDTAPVYGLGESERRLGAAAHGRRDSLWIATKTAERSRDGALAELAGSLERLGVERVDEWRLHHVDTIEELDACCRPGGALEALERARADGLVRYASISGHSDPGVLREALRRYPFDSVLVPVSALDSLRSSFVDELGGEAAARDTAIVGMKVHAHGALRHVAADALRHALAQPLSIVLLGCTRPEQLAFDLEVAASAAPMTPAEMASFAASLAPLLSPRTLPWRAAEWGRSGAWWPRWQPGEEDRRVAAPPD